jgi:hypothetical protein
MATGNKEIRTMRWWIDFELNNKKTHIIKIGIVLNNNIISHPYKEIIK